MTHISNTYRFFVSTNVINDNQVLLTERALLHQIGRVLRLRAGDHVVLLDGLGTAYDVVLHEVGRERVTGHVERQERAGGEPPLRLTLGVALLRPERFEWVLQKGTELGVTTFLPVVFERSLPADRANERKMERWHTIVREAAEQCCRARLPTIAAPQPVAAACHQFASADLALLLWEGEMHTSNPRTLRAVLRQWHTHQPLPAEQDTAHRSHIALLSGPEGGITPEELTTTREHGIISVSLGPRILRAETAPIAAAAAIWYECELR